MGWIVLGMLSLSLLVQGWIIWTLWRLFRSHERFVRTWGTSVQIEGGAEPLPRPGVFLPSDAEVARREAALLRESRSRATVLRPIRTAEGGFRSGSRP